MTDYKQLCAELVEKLDELNCHYNVPNQSAIVERAHAELAKPEPERLTVQEISNLPKHWDNYIAEDWDDEIQLDGRFSRADLQQLVNSIPNNRSNSND